MLFGILLETNRLYAAFSRCSLSKTHVSRLWHGIIRLFLRPTIHNPHDFCIDIQLQHFICLKIGRYLKIILNKNQNCFLENNEHGCLIQEINLCMNFVERDLEWTWFDAWLTNTAPYIFSIFRGDCDHINLTMVHNEPIVLSNRLEKKTTPNNNVFLFNYIAFN